MADRCHGCFNLLNFCTCVHDEKFLDPETGREWTRADLNRLLQSPAQFVEGGGSDDAGLQVSDDPYIGVTCWNPEVGMSFTYQGPLSGAPEWLQERYREYEQDSDDGWG